MEGRCEFNVLGEISLNGLSIKLLGFTFVKIAPHCKRHGIQCTSLTGADFYFEMLLGLYFGVSLCLSDVTVR